jgi:hypothetical protein
MQFSMARKFTLQPLRIYDVKPPEKYRQILTTRWARMLRILYVVEKKCLNFRDNVIFFIGGRFAMLSKLSTKKDITVD